MSAFTEQKFIILVLVMLSFVKLLSTKCISMIKQPWVVRLTLRELIPEELLYYLFIKSLDGICNTIKSPLCTIYLPIKKQESLKVFNMIAKNVSERLAKYI